MSLLSDLYKRITPAVAQRYNQIKNDVNPMANGAVGQAIDVAHNFIQNPANKIAIPNISNNTPFMQAPVEKVVRGAANLGIDLTNTIVGRGIIDPAMDLGKVASNAIDYSRGGVPNLSPDQYRSGAAKLGGRIIQGGTPQQYLADIGELANPIISAYAPKTVNALSMPTLRSKLLLGAKTGMQVGGLYGATQGLIEGRNGTLQNQLGNAFTQGVTGGAAGAALGAAIPLGGVVVKKGGKVSRQLGKDFVEGTHRKPGFIDLGLKQSESVIQPTGKVPLGGSEDLTAIRNTIRSGGKKESTDFGQVIKDAETNYYNRFAPIQRLEKGKVLSPSESPYTLLKRTTGSDGIANAKIEMEVTPVLKSVGKDLGNLDTFMVADRMGELSAQGRSNNPGKALEQLKNEIGDQRFANLQSAAQRLRSFQDNLLQEWKSVGGLSDEGYADIKGANQKYAPFQRVMDDMETAGFGGSSSFNSSKQPINKLKGSDRAIESPLESIVQNTYRMQKAIEKNRTMQALVGLGEDVGITKIKGDSTGKSVLNVFENGKKNTYEVPKDVADAIKGVDEEQLNLAIRVMALPAKVLRAGATGLNVGFAVPNIIRDQLSAAVNSKYGGVPIYDFISGLSSVLKKDDVYYRWLLSGADMATMASQDRGAIQKTVQEIAKGKPSLGRFVKDPLELLRAVSEYSEKGSRVGVFKRAEAGAAKEGLQGLDQQLMAMRQSREATIDFAQRGAKTKAANAIIPFLNARLQGSGKLIQSFKQRPAPTGLIGSAIALVPAATLYAYNTSSPDRAAIYDEIPDYIRENNFIFVTGNKDVPFLKIPKGEVGRIFGNPVENFMGYARGADQQSFADMSKSLLAGLSPVQGISDAIPTAFSVPLQVQSNYDTFRQRNIVSPYKTDLPPALQFDNKTSETSKWLGSKIGISPAKIDFVLKGYGAGVADQALKAADTLAFGKDQPTQNLPVLDKFLGEQNDLSRSAQKIYENEAKRKAAQAETNFAVKQRIQEYLRTGNEDLLKQAAEANPTSFRQFFNDALKQQEIDKITNPKDRAIQSLPKKQQELLGVTSNTPGLSTLPTTSLPTASASSGGVVRSPKNQADVATARAKVANGITDRVELPDRYIVSDNSDKGYREVLKSDLKSSTDAAKLRLDLQTAKNTSDYKGWEALQKQRYNAIEAENKKLDPQLDAVKILNNQNTQQDIINQVQKYRSYGNAFKKPKIGRARVSKVKIAKVKTSLGKSRIGSVRMKKVRSPKSVRIRKPSKLL